MWGPPGCGKTYAAYSIGVRGGLYALTLTENTPAAEIRGHYLPKGDGMTWHHGPATKAMLEGARLVINELTHGSADVLSIMHPLLENPDTARLTLPTGETVRPAPGFQLIATDNLPPEELPEALRDRFDSILHVREPHPAAIAQLDDAPARPGRALVPPRTRAPHQPARLVQRPAPDAGVRRQGRVPGRLRPFSRGTLLHDGLILGEAQN